jgi:pimeloyl-ACP methyl ester carboxylesterase
MGTTAKSLLERLKLRRLAYIFFVIVVLWVFLGYLATMPIVGNHTYWRQLRLRPGDLGLKAEDVSFSSPDGIALRAWYIAADGTARGTVILVHGIDGNRSDMLPRASFLVRNHYSTLLVDLRGHGESGGNYATPGYMEALDILGSVSYLRHSRHQLGPLAVLGHSYGAVAALYAAAQSPDIAAVVADSAFISFEGMMRRATALLSKDPERSFWARLGLKFAGSRAVEMAVIPIYYLRTGVWPSGHANVLLAISRIGQRPILFIAGERDQICPPDNTRIMYQAALSPNKSLLIVPHAEHDSTFTTAPDLYESTVVGFLLKAF